VLVIHLCAQLNLVSEEIFYWTSLPISSSHPFKMSCNGSSLLIHSTWQKKNRLGWKWRGSWRGFNLKQSPNQSEKHRRENKKKKKGRGWVFLERNGGTGEKPNMRHPQKRGPFLMCGTFEEDRKSGKRVYVCVWGGEGEGHCIEAHYVMAVKTA